MPPIQLSNQPTRPLDARNAILTQGANAAPAQLVFDDSLARAGQPIGNDEATQDDPQNVREERQDLRADVALLSPAQLLSQSRISIESLNQAVLRSDAQTLQARGIRVRTNAATPPSTPPHLATQTPTQDAAPEPVAIDTSKPEPTPQHAQQHTTSHPHAQHAVPKAHAEPQTPAEPTPPNHTAKATDARQLQPIQQPHQPPHATAQRQAAVTHATQPNRQAGPRFTIDAKPNVGTRRAEPLAKPQPQQQNVDPKQLDARIARVMVATAKRGGGEATIKLKPIELGELNVRVKLHQDTVSAVFEPSVEETRSLLAGSIDTLKEALKAHGLRVEQLDVLETRATEDDAVDPDDHKDRHQRDEHPHRDQTAHDLRVDHDDDPVEPELWKMGVDLLG